MSSRPKGTVALQGMSGCSIEDDEWAYRTEATGSIHIRRDERTIHVPGRKGPIERVDWCGIGGKEEGKKLQQ
jgi:hypothetical protein